MPRLKTLLDTLFAPKQEPTRGEYYRPWSPLKKDRTLAEYYKHVQKVAETGGPASASSIEQMAIVICELIDQAEQDVYIFGDPLPAELFQSNMVRQAMYTFHARSLKGRITVITNDLDYTYEAFTGRSDIRLDRSRLRILPMPADIRVSKLYRFVYVDDGPGSFWWNNFATESNRNRLTHSDASFKDALTSSVLHRFFLEVASRYGVQA